MLLLFPELIWNMIGRKLSSPKTCSSGKRNPFCASYGIVLFLNMSTHKHIVEHTDISDSQKQLRIEGSGLCIPISSRAQCFGPKNT